MALYINGNKTGGGGGNTDIVYLTQAEYDALPDSKLSDDKVYMITDVNGDGSQFQPVIYSEDEREVGVWIDGKPLYQKTVHTGALSTGDYSVAHNISNFDDLISVYGNFIYAGKKSPIPINSRNNINWNLTVADVSSTMINFEVGTNYSSTYDITDSYVVLQYTKTTDTAGSGTWTPQGVPAVHYSTDEQIVGTWVDGSTIYQKTYVAITDTQYLSQNAYLIGTVPNGLEKVIDFEGSLRTSDGTGYSSLNGIGDIAQWNFGIHISNTNLLLYGGSSLSSIPQNATCIVTLKYTKTSQGGN